MQLRRSVMVFFLAGLMGGHWHCSAPEPDEPGAQSFQDGPYTYRTVDGDPLQARIYTLDNGLTVFMSVFPEAPRIQTFIAVNAGSKHDPADATGLAHYLEHMLFKGTDRYGSLDYAKEKVLIDEIIDLYDQHYVATDPEERKSIYVKIDSVSYLASGYAIAGEYDKMIGAIGAKGTNAYTSVERTVYVNDIASNQLEKWLDIEAERFRNPVMRLFHTELEAVYEEKNISLDNDFSKMIEALAAGLYPTHPYGTQTTIGTVDHLKNPSLSKVIEYYNTYYVPNNMAICLSGEFDPSVAIRLIDEKFGGYKRKEVPPFTPPVEEPISAPVVKEVVGPDAENVMVSFRFAGAASDEADMLTMCDMILMNDNAGLIDLNLNQDQKVLDAFTYPDLNRDYSDLTLSARPREGQSLEEVKDLLLSQIELLKKGEFPDWLPEAVVNDLRLRELEQYQQNSARAHAFVDAFAKGISWERFVQRNDRLAAISKQAIVDFASRHFGNNYVVVYKRTGEDTSVSKVVKPPITPVQINREDQSEFVAELLSRKVPEIEPVFLDYQRDIVKKETEGGIPVYYRANGENDLFRLYYVWDMGTDSDRKLGPALDYLEFLGTADYSASELQQEFYKIACSFSVSRQGDQIQLMLSGLNRNFAAALALFEKLLNAPQPDAEALQKLVDGILKSRTDNKLNKGTILWSGLYNYGVYGAHSSYTNVLSEEELRALTPDELVALIRGLAGIQHRILYYGPAESDELIAELDRLHKTPATLKPISPAKEFAQLPSDANKVFVVDYDMKQAEIILLSRSTAFNPDNVAVRSLFNEYYGGGMSSVVFSTIRESKALAYAVFSAYTTPSKRKDAHYVFAYIGTQADKLGEATEGMMELLTEMPESDHAFTSSREAVIKKIQTERITRENILFNYEQANKLGVYHDSRKDTYEQIPNLKLSDLKDFHGEFLKDRHYTMLVLGDRESIDASVLQEFGEVQYLTFQDIFGY